MIATEMHPRECRECDWCFAIVQQSHVLPCCSPLDELPLKSAAFGQKACVLLVLRRTEWDARTTKVPNKFNEDGNLRDVVSNHRKLCCGEHEHLNVFGTGHASPSSFAWQQWRMMAAVDHCQLVRAWSTSAL